MMRLSFWSAAAVAAAAAGTSAFAPSSTATRRAVSVSVPSSFAAPVHVRRTTSMLHMQKSPQPIVNEMTSIEDSLDATLVISEVPFPLPSMGLTASMLTILLSFPLSASAAGPDWGIFEGRIGSLLHPITMGSLLLYSLYTAYLGFQWRRQRTMGDEIAALKSKLPATSTSAELGAVAAIVAETRETNLIEAQINALTRERKEIAAKGPRDQHFSQGALLACIGTLFAIEGPLNTYARAGKLFPGPHLYAGAGLVCLWAIAVACVPAMQKGNDAARTLHIGANVAGLGLFGWQVVSGIPILLKVIEKTSWP